METKGPDNAPMSALPLLAKEGRIDGETPWSEIHLILVTKLGQVMEGMNLRNKYYKDPLTGVSQCLETRGNYLIALLKQKFSELPPFTVQRLTELVIDHQKYYATDSPEKYLRALEQVLNAGFDVDWQSYSKLCSELQTVINDGEASHRGITLVQLDW